MQYSRPIVLVGMMGCGKTSVGKQLAQLLGCDFVDVDQWIETKEGKTITEIFEQEGEVSFRAMEMQAITYILAQGRTVVAFGGGAFMQEPIRQLVKEKAISVWIKADFDVLLERVLRKKTRPLLEKGDKSTILKQLLSEREPVYALADIVVDSTNGSHAVVVDHIIEKLNHMDNGNYS